LGCSNADLYDDHSVQQCGTGKPADPAKEDTGLFFFRGNTGEKFAVCNARAVRFIRKNADVYVTGSNSRMLSSDVKTEFRGRGYEIRVHPLSFSEFLKAGQYANELSALQDYMIYGGMPQVVSFSKKKKIISNHCFKGLIYAI
jgi:hypothetical protein